MSIHSCPECRIGLNNQEFSLGICKNCGWDADDDFEFEPEEDEDLMPIGCGMTPQGCLEAGSEYCDWLCPMNKETYL